MQELKVDNKIKVEKQGKKDEKEMESDQGEENNEKPNNIDRKDDKDIIYNEDSGDYLEDLEGSEKDSQDNEDKRYILKYNLSSVYFIKTNDYFKNFSTNKIIKRDFQKFLAFKGIPYEKEFREAIKKNGMLNKLFSETIKKINRSDEINKLKNGLFVYQNKKLLFYCRKDEEIEDNYLSDIRNLESIEYKEYDKVSVEEKNAEAKFAKSEEIIENNSVNSSNKSENRIQYKKYNFSHQSLDINKPKRNIITGLKSRALGLEALVHFYFKELKLISLPDIIFNISYKKKSQDEINLYYEWDGCFLSENQKDTKKIDIFPFHKENKFIIEYNSLKDNNISEERFQIQKDSLIFLEVKTHFPKTKETDEKQNLENLIKTMFIKLNYYICLYSEILKDVTIKNIYIILLYNKQRIKNYRKVILEQINKFKECFNDIKYYIIYFDIIFIFPSIGKLSLNYINRKIKNSYNIQNKKFKNLEEKNNKAQNDINIANEKIKNLEELNLKAQNDSIIANEKIKNLEELNLKAQNDSKIANEKIKNLEELNLKAQNDSIISNDKIKNLEKKVSELSLIIEYLKNNRNVPTNQINTLLLKSEPSRNNNNVCQINYNDSIAFKIKEKMNAGYQVYDYEKIYYKIFMMVYEKLNIKDLDLMNYKKNHTTNEQFKNLFHQILLSFPKKEVQNFFLRYEFIPCMTVCSRLNE